MNRIVIKVKIQEIIGLILYKLGFPHSASTGIHGGPTYGYGDLSFNGYWQYPCYPKRGDN